MGYRYKWKPSKSAAREFAQKMSEIEQYCKENGIIKSSSSDSYYFTHNGVQYRVSNHSVESSVNTYGTHYHGDSNEYRKHVFCINAGKTRIIDIHKMIVNGIKVDYRGNRI